MHLEASVGLRRQTSLINKKSGRERLVPSTNQNQRVESARRRLE